MDEQTVACPKCKSTQITGMNKGFSGGKAVAGAVLTGGIGILAGTHGSKKLIVACLNCGNKWDPAQNYQNQKANEKRDKALAELAERKKFKKQFYSIYESGNYTEAETFFSNRKITLVGKKDVHSTYKFHKAFDRDQKIVGYVLLTLLFGFIIWLFK